MRTDFNEHFVIPTSVVSLFFDGLLRNTTILGAVIMFAFSTLAYAQVPLPKEGPKLDDAKIAEITGEGTWSVFSHGQDPRCDWSKCQRGYTDGSEFLEGRFSFYLMYRCKQNGKYVPYSKEEDVCGKITRPISAYHECDARCYSEGIYIAWGKDTSATLNYLVDGDFGCIEKVPNSLGCSKDVGACIDKIKYDSPWSFLASEVFVGESCNIVGYKWGKIARDEVDNQRKYTGSFCFEPEKIKKPVQFFHDCGYSEKPTIPKTEVVPAGIVRLKKMDNNAFGDFVLRVVEIKQHHEKGKIDMLEAGKPLTGMWEMFMDGLPQSIWGREVLVLNVRRDSMYGYAFSERPVVTKPDKVLPKKLEAFRVMEVSGVVGVKDGVTGSGGSSVRVISLVKSFPQLDSPGRDQICLLAEDGPDEFKGTCESVTSGKKGTLLKRTAQVRMKRLNRPSGLPKAN